MKKKYIALLLMISSLGMFSQEEQTEEYFEISKNLTIFSEVYKNINLYFVDETNPGQLMKTGIDAMLKSLDPYTNYIPESNIEDYRMMQSGQYGGIGALIRKKDEYIQVTDPYESFPAHKAGLKAGDIIKKIDGKSIKGKSSQEVSELLKGAKGTDLSLTIDRKNESEPMVVKITREIVKIPSVPHFDMLSDDVGYIKLTQFIGTSSSELAAAFEKLKDSNKMKSLVLDLRGNPGGLLNESVKIVNMFVEQGTKVVETKGRLKQNNYKYFAKNKPTDLNIPIVVLISGSSASASEIVSGTLQDLDRAVIVGNQSYGKGLVQQTKDMEYNSIIKLTIAKYYTPSGRCIQRLDYSDRSTTGKGTNISDSLVQNFKTKNGRPVTDGRGVTPDVEVNKEKIAAITGALLRNNFIFDFATDFYYSNPSIPNPDKFELAEEKYNEFIDYVMKQEFEYSTGSEKILERLQKVAEEEKYYESSKAEFDDLIAKLSPDKKRDLNLFKNEIKQILENEIVSRYYYQKGRMKYDLKNDKTVQKAVEILNNPTKYEKILNP